jgi:hypothetical protein
MRQNSIALATVASLTLLDIALATATHAFSDQPQIAVKKASIENCFPQAKAGSESNIREPADIKILTKDKAEAFRSHREFGCADNPTSTIYV